MNCFRSEALPRTKTNPSAKKEKNRYASHKTTSAFSHALMTITLITGATSGIGYAFAHICAREQNDLVLVARNHKKLEEIKSDLEKKCNITVHIIPQDLSEKNSAQKVYTKIQEKNLQIDTLINNAGFGLYGDFSETDWSAEERMIQLNITTLTEFTKLFLEGMKKRNSGKILNVASTAAFQPGPLMAVYFATKAYVLHFSEAIADELRDTGITVTALCPGPTASGFQKEADIEASPLVKGKKLPTSEEVAEYGYQALQRGKRVATHGMINWALAQSVRFSPRRMVTWLVRKMQEKA